MAFRWTVCCKADLQNNTVLYIITIISVLLEHQNMESLTNDGHTVFCALSNQNMEQCIRGNDAKLYIVHAIFTETAQSAHRLPLNSNEDGGTMLAGHLQASQE